MRVGTTEVAATARGWIHRPGNAGFIKVVEDADRGVLVGATSAGPAGGEVLGAAGTRRPRRRCRSARCESMIYAYPTFHRGIQDALRDLR